MLTKVTIAVLSIFAIFCLQDIHSHCETRPYKPLYPSYKECRKPELYPQLIHHRPYHYIEPEPYPNQCSCTKPEPTEEPETVTEVEPTQEPDYEEPDYEDPERFPNQPVYQKPPSYHQQQTLQCQKPPPLPTYYRYPPPCRNPPPPPCRKRSPPPSCHQF